MSEALCVSKVLSDSTSACKTGVLGVFESVSGVSADGVLL